jgi:hypothetical protein
MSKRTRSKKPRSYAARVQQAMLARFKRRKRKTR